MDKINELKAYGEVTYVSKYIDVVGMTCTPHNFHKIKHLKNVFECENAETGSLL
jgi:uncharacterized protein YlbG (UPF0298 family)